jgi:uncharacterized membrane-anchored protein
MTNDESSFFKKAYSNPVLMWAVLTAIMGLVVSIAVDRQTSLIQVASNRSFTEKNAAKIDIWYTVAQDLKIQQARTTERLERLQLDLTDLKGEVRQLNKFLRDTQ